MKRFSRFQMSETTYKQITALPVSIQLKYFISVCDYGLFGIEPDFSGIEKSVFIPMKDLIDFAKERSKTNSANGKEGGAPEGNQNAKKQSKTSKNNKNQSDILGVIQEAKRNGFSIDNEIAQKFLELNINPEWLCGPHSFIEFAAERLHEKEKYKGLPIGQKKSLFISAVTEWKELPDDYPEWKSEKEKSDADTAWKAEIKTAWKKHPTSCVHCNGELIKREENFYCLSCNFICELNKDTLQWDWRKW